MSEKLEAARAEESKRRDQNQQARRNRDAALAAVRAEHDPLCRAAEDNWNIARLVLQQAEAEATPDHPDHGKRVFRIEKTYSRRFLAKPDGEKRVDGELVTFRPGDLQPRYGWTKPGELIVYPLLKSGKRAAKPVAYDKLWSFTSPEPSHHDA